MPAGPSIILPCKRVEIWALAIDRTDGGVEAVSANRIVALFAISLLGVIRRVLNVESHKTCKYDHLTIRDGDGTTLMKKRCGSSLPANTIISTSNRVELYFMADYYGDMNSGWSVSWSAVQVIQGE